MTVYALIPARGGSQRIPRKNLELVGGISLVARAIRVARAAATVDVVWVSTDDAEIAAASFAEGGETTLILDRPPHLALHDTPMELVVEHFAEYVGMKDDDLIVLLEPTAPLRRAADIDVAVWALRIARAPAVRLVSALPFLKGCHVAMYRDAGLANVIRVDTLRSGCLFPQGTLLLHHGDDRAIDVDDVHDLERARALADS